MPIWVRRTLISIGVLAVVGGAAYYWLVVESRMPSDAAFAFDINQVRRAVAAVPGDKPATVEVEHVGSFQFPATAIVAGDGLRQVDADASGVFGDAVPPLSSTKGLSGHSLGAASVHEAIYCLQMMREGFMAGSVNIDRLDPRVEGFPILRESRAEELHTVMSNSFGFGGTNATLVFGRA